MSLHLILHYLSQCGRRAQLPDFIHMQVPQFLLISPADRHFPVFAQAHGIRFYLFDVLEIDDITLVNFVKYFRIQ